MATETASHSRLCPRCSEPMSYLQTVWRGILLDLNVLQCEPCALFLDHAVLARPLPVIANEMAAELGA